MHYMMNDTDLYLEMLGTFVQESPQRKAEISRYRSEKELKEYQIRVHALKSASRNIGADTLSDLALQQETAAKETDLSVIETDYPVMISEYDRIVGILSELTGVSASETEGSDEEDDEILEFFPEDEL